MPINQAAAKAAAAPTSIENANRPMPAQHMLGEALSKLTPEQFAERTKQICATEANVAITQQFLKDLSEFSAPYEFAALFGLIKLQQFGQTIGQDSQNWLGCFVFDILRDVAWEGPIAVSNDFEGIQQALENAHKYVEDDVEQAINMMESYPTIVERLRAKKEAAVYGI